MSPSTAGIGYWIGWLALVVLPLVVGVHYRRRHGKNAVVDVAPAAASMAIGIVPLMVLERWYGVPRQLTVGYGFLSYICGVALLKMPIYHALVVRHLHGRLSHAPLAASQGFVSALSEMGAAAAFFAWVVPSLTFWQVVGFGYAAGAVEAIVLPVLGNVMTGTPLEEHAGRTFEAARSDRRVAWLSVLERALACVVHTSSRGLVYVGVTTASALPAALAVVTVAAIDGPAYYAHLEKWRFDDPRVLARMYVGLGGMAALQAAAFLWWYG